MIRLKSLKKQSNLNSIDSPPIISLINDIEKYECLDDEVTVRNLNYLSYWLYVLGRVEDALSIT